MSDLPKDVHIDPEDVEALVLLGLEAGVNDPADLIRTLRKIGKLNESGDNGILSDESQSTADLGPADEVQGSEVQ